MRRLTIVLALALVAAACGDDGASSTSAPTASTAVADSSATSDAPAETTATTSSPATTSGPEADDEGTAATEPESPGVTADPSLPDAADFTLALGEGGSFTLSEEQKPVYMVFWAEW